MTSSNSGILRSSVMPAASFVDKNAKLPTDPVTNSFTLFFYGTLVHPSILSRMIGHQGVSLLVQPAILEGYALHHVKGEDYPALIPLKESRQLISQSEGIDSTITAVRGTLVKGLSEMDVKKLDQFEGDEYIRTPIEVLVDDQIQPIANNERSKNQSIEQVLSSLTSKRIQDILSNPPTPQKSHIYRWHAPIDMLEPRIWKFETFMSSGDHHKWWNDAS